MKQAGELAREAASRPQSNESARPTLNARLSSELCVRLAELYGHKWVSQYGETLPETWARGLSDMSGADIGNGLIQCLKSGHEWPPSLPEFRAMCKPKRENAAMYREFPPMLENKVSDEQTAKAREAIRAMRAKL